MLKKRVLSVAGVAIAAAIGLVGCSPTRVVKDGTFKGLDVSPKVHGVAVTVAELEVSPTKVTGSATGFVGVSGSGGERIRSATLESEALARALRGGNPQAPGADVLVGVNYHYARAGGYVTVTAVGYPARYKNFRPEGEAASASPFIVNNVGGMSVIGFDPNATSVEVADGYWIVTRVSGESETVKPQTEVAPAHVPAQPAQQLQYAPQPQPVVDHVPARQYAPEPVQVVPAAPIEPQAPTSTVTPTGE